MNTRILGTLLVALSALMVLASMDTVAAAKKKYSIDKPDVQMIYWGSASEFYKPAEVDFEEALKTTPEYKSIKKKKIAKGSGKYWILLSQASDRVVRAIREVGEDTDYDFIAAAGYLGDLKPSIPAEDITDLVIEYVEDNAK